MDKIKSLREREGTQEVIYENNSIEGVDEKTFHSLWNVWVINGEVERTDHDGWTEFTFKNTNTRPTIKSRNKHYEKLSNG